MTYMCVKKAFCLPYDMITSFWTRTRKQHTFRIMFFFKNNSWWSKYSKKTLDIWSDILKDNGQILLCTFILNWFLFLTHFLIIVRNARNLQSLWQGLWWVCRRTGIGEGTEIDGTESDGSGNRGPYKSVPRRGR